MEAKVSAKAPYPAHLLRVRRLADGRAVLIRPVREEDDSLEREFFEHLSEATRRLRFQRYTGVLSDELIQFYTHVDYARHMAFVCEHDGHIVGEARYVANPGTRSCELGIVIADDWHHTGIAQLLIDALTRAANARGFEVMEGLVLSDNAEMLGFVREMGFDVFPAPQDASLVRVVKQL